MSHRNIKSMAIIGAGPAGAIALHALIQERTFDIIRVFDRRSQLGGSWVYTPHLDPKFKSLNDVLQQTADKTVPVPKIFPRKTNKSESVNDHQLRFSDTPMHEHLESNIPASIMAYTQEPFPDIISKSSATTWGNKSPFRHREVIRGWVESIFSRHGYEKYVELETTLELAEKVGEKWVLTLRKETAEMEEDCWWQENFDALVVANGHYNVPHIPSVPGLVALEERFPGTVVHSKHYRRPENYRGKKIIVVGASVSAFDITHEVVRFAQTPVYCSVRGASPIFGVIPLDHPSIVQKPTISHVSSEDGKKIVFFPDGSKVEDVDHILYGTGYTFSLPFLPLIKTVNRIVPNLYLHVFSQDDPTLTFIGGTAGGFTFRVFEWQAVAIARIFAGKAKLPPAKEQQQWVDDRLAKIPACGFAFIKIGDDFEGYFESLRILAGKPEEGSPGHVLPKFDPAWVEVFAGTLQDKINFWKKAKVIAERNVEAKKEGKFYDEAETPLWSEDAEEPLQLRAKL